MGSNWYRIARDTKLRLATEALQSIKREDDPKPKS
jgi:hypothetical protein